MNCIIKSLIDIFVVTLIHFSLICCCFVVFLYANRLIMPHDDIYSVASQKKSCDFFVNGGETVIVFVFTIV